MDAIERSTRWTAPAEEGLDAGRVMSPTAMFVGLRLRGLTAEQAGNLVGRLHGLAATAGGWSPQQIDRLRFARWLAAHHTIDG